VEEEEEAEVGEMDVATVDTTLPDTEIVEGPRMEIVE